MSAGARAGASLLRAPEGAAGLRGAAFFDLDRTLIAGSSAFAFGRAAARAGPLTPAMLAAVLPRILPGILELAWAHQDAGRPAYICSATSTEVAELMAIVLRLDGGLATRSEIVDGHYTGRNEGPFTYGEGKAQALRKLAAAQGIELSASYAYSDAISDVPFLRAVGHPVAVNPDAALLRLAGQEGWEVIRADRLGRRLQMGAASLVTAAVAAGALARQRR